MQPAAGMLQAVLGIGPLRFAVPRTVDLRLAVPGTAGLRTAAVPLAGLGTVRTAAEQTEGLAVEPAQTAEPEVLLDMQAERRIVELQVLAAGLPLAVQQVQLVQSEVQLEPEMQQEPDQACLEVPGRLELAAPSSEPS